MCEIERRAGHVSDPAAGLLDDKLAGSVVPDFLAVVGPGRKSKIDRCVAACDRAVLALAVDAKRL